MKKHPFSLQELLIFPVIFIALAALCIPVLNGAVKRGSKMSCLDKQKALYQAFSSYTAITPEQCRTGQFSNGVPRMAGGMFCMPTHKTITSPAALMLWILHPARRS